MAFCIFYFFYYVIVMIHMISHVSALTVESIVGGYVAHGANFTYQVSVQARANYSKIYVPVCGGGILNQYYVLSAALCFVNKNGSLIERSFSVVAGTTALHRRHNFRADVNVIYLPGFDPDFNTYNIAILKLKHKLFDKKLHVTSLPLPKFQESFSQKRGRVSGFGFDWIQTGYRVASTQKERLEGSSSNVLKYASVQIITDEKCKEKYEDLFNVTHMCGLTIPYNVEEAWGICEGDIGNPLVINGKFAGIASKSPIDCDDSVTGALYIKVAAFVNFIKNLKDGMLEKDTIVHYNRRHIK